MQSIFNWVKTQLSRQKQSSEDSAIFQAAEDLETFGHIPSYAFRLSSWPALSDSFKTAKTYRVLSVMTVKPVSWDWINLTLGEKQSSTITLLQELDRAKVLQVFELRYASTAHTVNKIIDIELRNAAQRRDVRSSQKSGF